MKKKTLKRLAAGLLAATTAAALPITASASWVKAGGAWQWTENGTPVTGWRWISGDSAWYHFNASGDMNTGWLQEGSNWYYLQPSGAMSRFWNQIGGKWYFMNTSGAMQQGWVMAKGRWYFLGPDGAMITGVAQVDGKTYYFDQNGAMVTGRVEIDGKAYTFDSDGKALGTAPKAEKAYKTIAGATVEVPVTVPASRPTTGGGSTAKPDPTPEEPTPADPSVATVTDEAALTAALENAEVKEIKLGASFAVSKSITLTKNLDGGGKTLSLGENAEIVVNTNDITVKNVTVDAGLEKPAQWEDGVYALKVYNATGVTLENVTAKNANVGIQVNGSAVTLKDKINVSGNGFGGIEVCKGEGADLSNGALTIDNAAELTNDDEAATNPTIYIEKDEGTVTGAEELISKEVEIESMNKNQTFYFLNETSIQTANVDSAEVLQAVLTMDEIKTIKLTADVNVSECLDLTGKTLDGSNHTLTSTYTKPEGEANGSAIVVHSDSTIKNLTVEMTLDALETWSGAYCIQAYNATDVHLENVTVSGANAGILVNGSTVTLQGEINVSGNGFGGIEVSKGIGVDSDSILTIAEDAVLTNTSEEDGKPTIWVEGTDDSAQGTVTGGPDHTYTFTKEDGSTQLHYYLDEKNIPVESGEDSPEDNESENPPSGTPEGGEPTEEPSP